MYRKKSDEIDRKSRRRIFPGYPIETPFNSIEAVREYISGDSIICLLCGKKFKRLNIHLHFIHEMTADEYKEKYSIPWTYALACEESSKLSADAMHERIDKGELNPLLSMKKDKLDRVHRQPQRACPFANEILNKNKHEYFEKNHPLVKGEDGILRTKTEDTRRKRKKLGSPEHKEIMSKSSKKRAEEGRLSIIGYWKGKKQTPEHIHNRLEGKRKKMEKKEV